MGEKTAWPVDLLKDAWVYVDQMVTAAQVQFRKDPTGGGRGRDVTVTRSGSCDRGRVGLPFEGRNLNAAPDPVGCAAV